MAVVRQARREGGAIVEHEGLPSLRPAELLLEGVDGVPPGQGSLLGAGEGEVLGLGDVFHFCFYFFGKEGVEV